MGVTMLGNLSGGEALADYV